MVSMIHPWRSIVLTCACGMQQIEECLPMAEKVREAVPDLVSFFNCQGEQPDVRFQVPSPAL